MFGILAFGDSIVFGRGNNIDRGWVGRLRRYFEAKDYYNGVYNLGIPGNNSTDLLNRFETECTARIKKNYPEDRFIILIGIGINDSKFVDTKDNPETEPAKFKENILKLIELSKKYTDEVIFIGLTPVDESLTDPYETTFFFNERIKQFNDTVSECCKDKGTLFLDMFSELQKLDYTKLLDDGLHLNAAGYDKMYEIIKDFLIENKVID
jgi:lysophospholipase L1-like esterase